jgi:ribosomal protein S18 acetylase RimI-like enzyme
MSDFPTGFSTIRPVSTMQAGDQAAAAFRQLAAQNYALHLGLTPEHAAQILTMSQEPAIREYCPKDSSERFTNRKATEKWLAKQRAVFLLFEQNGTRRLVGYGWAGPAIDSHVPAGRMTFALRIGQAGQGRGLAAPFSWLIIAVTAKRYGVQHFWLETWASNGAAVHIYHKLGFETVAEESSRRPAAVGGTVADTRVYMYLPDKLLSHATR